ncbi:DNA polymerase III subunit delta [Candidatus Termititenax persephonae]|uniref:DNA polymerase III subunit delta n=1 Tax=Candidatus Termititenax persephonae TaxID=2218525 RepID=A0A388TGF8_9BACT|nr:DNA polymerase III subunit delta [Candidatus Termititenax persephonae]
MMPPAAAATAAAPSQQRARGILDGIVRTGRVANGYIFAGAPGCGKTAAARDFFQKLTRTDKIKSVDFYELTTDKAQIAIEQVRALKQFVQYGPRELAYLLVVIQNAEKFSAASGNAFLKLLEEPPDGVVFILETFSPEALLPTIVSRCQLITFDSAALLKAGTQNAAAENNWQNLQNFIQDLPGKNFWQISQLVDIWAQDRQQAQQDLLRLAQVKQGQGAWRQANLVLKYAKMLRSNINLRLAMETLFLRMRDLA